MRFEEAYTGWTEKRLTQEQATQLLGVCERTFRRYIDRYKESMWWTVRGGGDRDTTCAIVGGIVALSAPVPRAWVERREPLPPL